jgi:CRISPR system Cascade subunit CasC
MNGKVTFSNHFCNIIVEKPCCIDHPFCSYISLGGIHVIENHAPSNLNRDDTGSPKDCIFGGVRRARISSQCLKRSIRRSPLFSEQLGADLAVRTRLLPVQVKKRLLERGLSEEMAEIGAQKASGFGNKDGKEQAELRTAQIMLLSEPDIEAVTEAIYRAALAAKTADEFKAVSAKDLQTAAELKGWRPITPDIALFGRMITSNAFRDVEASVQVAHAISTHKMDHEFDYYTAVDDLLGSDEDEDDSGAGMIGDVEFNSACYYKYFSLDFDALVANLTGPEPGPKATKAEREAYEKSKAEAKAVAAAAVPAFIRAAVFTTPSGKQNTFAAHQLPDAILVEVRPENIPVSYANAFVEPARTHNGQDLVSDSLDKFSQHVGLMSRKFSLHASPRLWFTTRDEVKVEGARACDTLDDLFAALQKAVGDHA